MSQTAFFMRPPRKTNEPSEGFHPREAMGNKGLDRRIRSEVAKSSRTVARGIARLGGSCAPPDHGRVEAEEDGLSERVINLRRDVQRQRSRAALVFA